MSKDTLITLGEMIYSDIDANTYLNELYGNILYNYALMLFKIEGYETKPVSICDALSFADILSKSTDAKKADKHKIWAQEIVVLLDELYPQDDTIRYFMGSVLSSTGNYRGISTKKLDFQNPTLLDLLYTNYSLDYMSIPAEPENKFFRSQRTVYNNLYSPYFSYSGPTSMGKSYIMQMFIKEQVMNNATLNFVILVPTKALINEVGKKLTDSLRGLLAEKNYKLVYSSGALVLKEKHNFIFVLTPERLLYLLISHPDIDIDYLFVDEAHKISSKDKRSTFYYKVVDMLSRRNKKSHIIFSSPNIPNPEVYLNLIPQAQFSETQKITSSFAPVNQFKFLINFSNQNIQIYNEHTGKLMDIPSVAEEKFEFFRFISCLGKDKQSIIYCSAKDKAVDWARRYADLQPQKDNLELIALSKDIKAEIHAEYFLADVIKKGVAYHVGYLPATIRMRIEKLYRSGAIHTLFCTSTLIEGVNLPADNLFITSYYNGHPKMKAVDFNNLVGRVGRIDYNLYGNVFLMHREETRRNKLEGFIDLLQKEVPEQTLSIETGLTSAQKTLIVDCLKVGDIELQTAEQKGETYEIMRKFALILLSDITANNNSRVRKEFSSLIDAATEQQIKTAFCNIDAIPDNDINVSVDQTVMLRAAISQDNLHYPPLTASPEELLCFLKELGRIFKWKTYEKKTLGNGNSLSYYAVILSRWIEGNGLNHIIKTTLDYKQRYRRSVWINGESVPFDNSPDHRNRVISDTLSDIDHVILFSFANYFLRFSEEYKKYHGITDSFENDWYEFVEYGTTNRLSIMLQRNGFTRETALYIKRNQPIYVVQVQGESPKLRRRLAQCGNESVEQEIKDIIFNLPELFVD